MMFFTDSPQLIFSSNLIARKETNYKKQTIFCLQLDNNVCKIIFGFI